MITKINRFNMMKEQTIMKIMKKRKAYSEPHVSPGIQFGGTLDTSYIILFQSSPVLTLIRIIIE